MTLEPHHAAARQPTDEEAAALADRDLEARRADLFARMEASNRRRLDRLREDEGRLL